MISLTEQFVYTVILEPPEHVQTPPEHVDAQVVIFHDKKQPGVKVGVGVGVLVGVLVGVGVIVQLPRIVIDECSASIVPRQAHGVNTELIV